MRELEVGQTAAQLPPPETGGRETLSRVIASWRKSKQPDARRAMDQYPQLGAHRSWAVELAYEEFCIRQERGESLDASRYCRLFPTIHKSLARQLDVHRYVTEHPQVLDHTRHVRWPQPGEIICAKFAVCEELGRGAIARVYLCRQLGVGDRQVVVKMASDGAYEADTLGKLSHPHIMPVYAVEVDLESMVSAICMPFYGRSTLCDVMDCAWGLGSPPESSEPLFRAARRSYSPDDTYDVPGIPHRRRWRTFVDQVVQIGADLADALQHAHANGIRHDDLKPSNVLVTNDCQPLLMDFNLSDDNRRPAFLTGGTLPYMSPGQLREAVLGEETDARLDHRSDIFSLGTILYELLTGQLPFDVRHGSNEIELACALLQRQAEGAVPVHRRNRRVNRRLSDTIMRCLEFDRSKRPECAEELRAALQRQLRRGPRGRRWYLARRRRVILGTAIFLTGGAAAAYSASHDPQLREYLSVARGRYLLDRGDFAAAEACLRSIRDGRAQALLGYCYLKMNQLSAAERAHREALSLGFRSAGLYSNLGLLCVNNGQPEQALEFVRRALELAPKAVTPRYIRARLNCLRLSTDPNAVSWALEDLTQVLASTGPNGELYQMMGLLHSQLANAGRQHIELAIEYYTKAYSHGMDPRNVRLSRSTAVMEHPRIERLLEQEPRQVPFRYHAVMDPTSTLL